MTYQLDTSGSVGIVTAAPQGGSYCQTVRWSGLSPFAQGYIEALFAGLNESRSYMPGDGQTGARELGFSDLAPETLAQIIADCEAANTGVGGAANGAAFWSVRNKPLLPQGEWSADFPPLTVQLGDDGKVRFAA